MTLPVIPKPSRRYRKRAGDKTKTKAEIKRARLEAKRVRSVKLLVHRMTAPRPPFCLFCERYHECLIRLQSGANSGCSILWMESRFPKLAHVLETRISHEVGSTCGNRVERLNQRPVRECRLDVDFDMGFAGDWFLWKDGELNFDDVVKVREDNPSQRGPGNE